MVDKTSQAPHAGAVPAALSLWTGILATVLAIILPLHGGKPIVFIPASVTLGLCAWMTGRNALRTLPPDAPSWVATTAKVGKVLGALHLLAAAAGIAFVIFLMFAIAGMH